jgi:hypothetical protein
MSNPRSASNAWAKIKAKMVFAAPADGAAPATPKRGRPKKQNAEDALNKGKTQDGEDTPNTKKPTRKRAAKKQDGEGTPAKKRATAGKAAAAAATTAADAESDAGQSLIPIIHLSFVGD